jgi:TolB protein
MRVHPTLLALALGAAPFGAMGAEGVDAACLVLEDNYWQVAALDVKTGRTRVLSHSPVDKSRVSWFPSGELLVSRNDGTLTVLDPSSGQEKPVTLEQHPIYDAAVSPDGSRVAFSFSTAIDGNDIWVVDWPGKAVKSVVRMPALQHDPAWSADGRGLYFLSGDGGQAHDIWRFAPDTQSREQLTVGELYHFDVTVGPGDELAYSANREGNYEIYWRPAGKGKPERLTEDPALDARPAFSPDGRSLLFESSRSGTMQIYRLDVKSKKVTPVTKAAGGARMPVWRMPGVATAGRRGT